MPAPPTGPGHVFEGLSHVVLGACIDMQRQMGAHCMEVDYQRALEVALPKHGLQYQREVDIPVVYDGVVVTTRRVDFVVWDDKDEILLEIKAASALKLEDLEQCVLIGPHHTRPLCARKLPSLTAPRETLCTPHPLSSIDAIHVDEVALRHSP